MGPYVMVCLRGPVSGAANFELCYEVEIRLAAINEIRGTR